MKPIGHGVFGDTYDQFRGKVREAFTRLMKDRGGDYLGVFYRDGVGDIDMVWGDKDGGLEHILDKHVGAGKSFTTAEDAIAAIEDIINNGKKSFENGNKIVFNIGGKQVTIRKNYRENGKKIADKNWVLTACDEVSADSESPVAVNQGKAGNATNKSDNKGTNLFGNGKEKVEAALRDGLVETMREAGIEVSTDWEEGQAVLEADRERRARLMGSRVEKRKQEIASKLDGKKMSDEQQAVADVFTGRKNRARIQIARDEGNAVSIELQQGNEQGAGTKHSIYKHYGTSSNSYTAEEIMLIPDIIRNGERHQVGSKVTYQIVENGVKYTVTTEQSKLGNERFTIFFTNRKPTAVENDTSNTDEQHVSQQSVSAAKLQNYSETEKKISTDAKFFRTTSGEAYGFVKGDKMYIDPRIATSETPIHEYAHMWAEGLRRANPEAWEQLKTSLESDKELVDYVKRMYPELEGDELWDEVFTHYSGRRGAERLRAEQAAEMEKAQGVFDKARVARIFDSIRRALSEFWDKSRQIFAGKVEGLDKMSAEDFADMAMSDMLGGFNPLKTVSKKQRKDGSSHIEMDEPIRFDLSRNARPLLFLHPT